MVFNNIIYFIVVLLIFNINYPEGVPDNSLFWSLTFLCITWLVFAGYCRWVFRALQGRINQRGQITGRYHRLVTRLSILAVFLFALDVYFFNLKYWLQLIPGFERWSFLQGLSALALFLFYLCTIWYFAYPAYRVLFQSALSRTSFTRSNLKLNLPVLFPWMILSFLYDLLTLTPLAGPGAFLNRVEGQMVFFVVFLILLMVFLPWAIRYWWECKPIEASEKKGALQGFLREKGFKYRDLLRWPIFEGRMMTAGIMGIIPRYRYILVTDSLLEVLSVEELKAVLAHEMGHAKYGHLLFYLVFFAGFMVISFGLFDLFFYLLYAHPYFFGMLSSQNGQGVNFFCLALSLPMLGTLLIYFRFVMGFFMRHFERQADLYSAVTMGSPIPTINSLEKIALLSGKIRDLPSWHHFSIRERVECLWKTLRDPGLIRRHNRFMLLSFLTYVFLLVGAGYLLNFSPVKTRLTYDLAEKVMNEQLLKEPENTTLYQNLATLYYQQGRYEEAIEAYEKVISLEPNHAMALNNLAWFLATVPREELRDEKRALELAKGAVALERSPMVLDTLAEAYYANGFVPEAVEAIQEAVSRAKENKGYYESQLRRFLAGKD